MKIEELKEKQQEIFERVTKKCPHLICVMVGREIETEGDKVIIEFKPGEEMLRKIADRYLGDLFEVIDEMTEEDVKVALRGGERKNSMRNW